MLIFIMIAPLIILTIVFFLLVSKAEEEKREFFHVVAHRFRSPISIVKWYIELISDKSVGTLNEKQKEYLDEIYKAGARLNEIIESLLILLQIESNKLPLKVRTTDIKNLIDQILLKLQFSVQRHRLHLAKIYPDDKELVVQTDPKLFGIVFENLVANAIRYTPENGNINIKADTNNQELLY